MSHVATLFFVVLFLSPIFYVGYRVGYRRGQRSSVHSDATKLSRRPAREVTLAGNLNHDVMLTYVDSSGERTERRFTIHEILGGPKKGPTYIMGYCHLRKQPRTFKVEFIEQLIDLSTGVVSEKPRDVIATFLHPSA